VRDPKSPPADRADRNFIETNNGSKVTVTYSVKRRGVEPAVPSKGVTFVVGVSEPLYIDPSTLTLTNTNPVQGHQATGGVEPYTYASDNPNVVRVTDAVNGTVQAVTDGSTTITVYDSATPKHSATYPVTAIVTAPLYIDPSTLSLINTTPVQGHQATGGVKPYTYASDNPNVVRVTNAVNGTVQAVTNGEATITVYDSATPMASKSYRVVASGMSEWDHEYNFDQDGIRYIGPGSNEVIYFPTSGGTMNLQFDPDPETPHPVTERLGVEHFPFTPTGNFSGNNVYIGYPPDKSHENTVFINFDNSWDVVSFWVTSASRKVTISFKDDALNILGAIHTISEGKPERETPIVHDDNGNGRIRHAEIRSLEVIRLDSFKFKK